MNAALVSSNPHADTLRRLDYLPCNRILSVPFPATEADWAQHWLGAGRGCELIDGLLVEKDVASSESNLALWLVVLIDRFIRPHNLGLLLGEQGAVRLFAGQIRMPDVSFIAWARCPQRRRPVGNVWAVIPNLAVEILSAGNTLGELRRKRDDYFLAGVELVWEIDPRTRTIAVFTQAAEPDVTLAVGATLTGGTVLPGFLLPLADLFAELDRTG